MTRAEVVAMYRKTSSIWRSNPDCIRKCYLYHAENHLGGGAYLWRTLLPPSARTARSGGG